MNEQTSGNGNGKSNAFEDHPPKSSEEAAQEQRKKIAPEIRRMVREMDLPAQVKFLFAAMLDDSFAFKFGGDGKGTINANVRQLSERYRHDKDSITKWLAVLIRQGVIWVEWAWPYSLFHIEALCPRPARAPVRPYQRAMARASAAGNKAEGIGFVPGSSPNSGSPPISEEIGQSEGKVSDNKAEGIGFVSGHLPLCKRKVSDLLAEGVGQKGGNLPLCSPIPPATKAEVVGGEVRNLPLTSPKVSALQEETPLEIGDSGDKKGGPPLPPDGAFEDWIKSLVGHFPSKLEKMREKFRGQLKQATPSGKALLSRKIATLDELLDGPQPEWASPTAAAAPVPKPKPAPMPLEKAKSLWAKAKKEGNP